MRSDLPRGIQAAHLIHAAGETSPGNLPDSTHAIALTVPSEGDLLIVAHRLAAAGVTHKIITEPDAPWNGAPMAIGIAPGRKEDLRRHLSSLPLLR